MLKELDFPFAEALDIVYPTFHLSDDAQKSFVDIVAKEGRSTAKRRGSRSVIAATLDKALGSSSPLESSDEQIAQSREHQDPKSVLVLTPSFKHAADSLSRALSVG